MGLSYLISNLNGIFSTYQNNSYGYSYGYYLRFNDSMVASNSVQILVLSLYYALVKNQWQHVAVSVDSGFASYT